MKCLGGDSTEVIYWALADAYLEGWRGGIGRRIPDVPSFGFSSLWIFRSALGNDPGHILFPKSGLLQFLPNLGPYVFNPFGKVIGLLQPRLCFLSQPFIDYVLGEAPFLSKFYGRNHSLLSLPVDGIPRCSEIFGQLRQCQNIAHPKPPSAADISLPVLEAKQGGYKAPRKIYGLSLMDIILY
jgi:hypothetical protein